MNKYKIIYRNLRGITDNMIITASNENSARYIFSSRFDGNILDVIYLG